MSIKGMGAQRDGKEASAPGGGGPRVTPDGHGDSQTRQGLASHRTGSRGRVKQESDGRLSCRWLAPVAVRWGARQVDSGWDRTEG